MVGASASTSKASRARCSADEHQGLCVVSGRCEFRITPLTWSPEQLLDQELAVKVWDEDVWKPNDLMGDCGQKVTRKALEEGLLVFKECGRKGKLGPTADVFDLVLRFVILDPSPS